MAQGAPARIAVARTVGEREAAFRLRLETIVAEGWVTVDAFPAGMERDDYDDRAVILVGWQGDLPVCTTRLVLPSGSSLPTEEACDIVVEPRGAVADVGRIIVAPSRRHRRHRLLVPLLAETYLEMRRQGFSVACGMMTPVLRSLLGLLGFELDVLGPDRPYWHEQRAPVRFRAADAAGGLLERWSAR